MKANNNNMSAINGEFSDRFFYSNATRIALAGQGVARAGRIGSPAVHHTWGMFRVGNYHTVVYGAQTLAGPVQQQP